MASRNTIRSDCPGRRSGLLATFPDRLLLMSLQGIADSTHIEREIVDLIWFPTGGGKTEAYLGLTAFTVFFNAISGTLPAESMS